MQTQQTLKYNIKLVTARYTIQNKIHNPKPL